MQFGNSTCSPNYQTYTNKERQPKGKLTCVVYFSSILSVWTWYDFPMRFFFYPTWICCSSQFSLWVGFVHYGSFRFISCGIFLVALLTQVGFENKKKRIKNCCKKKVGVKCVKQWFLCRRKLSVSSERIRIFLGRYSNNKRFDKKIKEENPRWRHPKAAEKHKSIGKSGGCYDCVGGCWSALNVLKRSVYVW